MLLDSTVMVLLVTCKNDDWAHCHPSGKNSLKKKDFLRKRVDLFQVPKFKRSFKPVSIIPEVYVQVHPNAECCIRIQVVPVLSLFGPSTSIFALNRLLNGFDSGL